MSTYHHSKARECQLGMKGLPIKENTFRAASDIASLLQDLEADLDKCTGEHKPEIIIIIIIIIIMLVTCSKTHSL